MWRATFAAVMLALVLAGCGQQSSRRAGVATYLKKVDRIEAGLRQPLGSVTSAGQAFTQEQRAGGTLTGLVTASQEQQLLRALSEVKVLRARLAAVPVPAAATRLRTMLLQIVDVEAQLTRELAQLVVFLPRYQAELRSLTPATARLESALSRRTALGPAGVAALYSAKAAALRQFAASVDALLTRVRRLRPPALQVPNYRTQVASMEGMSTIAGQLASSLQGGPHGNVQQLLVRFERAATLNQTVASQKAQIAAIRAYDGETVKLTRLSQAAEQERQRLANNLS